MPPDPLRYGEAGLDQTDFEAFYASTRNALWAYIIRVVRDSAQADDLLQDSYVRFIQSRKLPGEEKARRAYLFRIAINLCRDHLRALRRQRQWHSEASPSAESESADALGTSHDVGAAFAQLPEQQRTLLWLAYVEGYTHREIAGIMNVREVSVRVMLFRARRKFASILKQTGMTQEKGA